MCHKSKKWSMTGLPSSLHFLGHSSLIHLAIEACLSEINAVIIIPVDSRKQKLFGGRGIPLQNCSQLDLPTIKKTIFSSVWKFTYTYLELKGNTTYSSSPSSCFLADIFSFLPEKVIRSVKSKKVNYGLLTCTRTMWIISPMVQQKIV